MSVSPSRLLHREIVASDTLACIVERPAGFVFEAGQYIDVTLAEPLYNDALGPTRSFSIASAPDEADLLILMRVRDTAFKRSISEMPLGDTLLIDGPADDLALKLDGSRPLVLLAGGVGVAPFLGALRETARRNARQEVALFYSNRLREDAAYLEELDALQQRIPGFRFIPTLTGAADATLQWTGETGRIGVPMLMRHLPSLVGSRYYLSGSPSFISGLCQEIERAGVPGGDIRIEMYTGY